MARSEVDIPNFSLAIFIPWAWTALTPNCAIVDFVVASTKAEEAERAKRDEMLAEMEAEAQNEHDASNVEVINEKNNEEENNQE